jgi:hypothetical protein
MAKLAAPLTLLAERNYSSLRQQRMHRQQFLKLQSSAEPSYLRQCNAHTRGQETLQDLLQ